MNELQQQEQETLRMVRYLKRLSMEIETIKKQLKSGEMKIRKGKWTETETEVGHGGGENSTSPLSTISRSLVLPASDKPRLLNSSWKVSNVP